MTDTTYDHDCIVVGGGPAGTTAATLMAIHGHDVLLVDRAKFPRPKVGESMIPYNYFPLERIGMLDKLRASQFPEKYSVQFVRQDGSASQPFYFDEHIDHPCAQTWQVTRDVFDQMMLDNAREHGVTVMEETKAMALIEEDGANVGIRVQTGSAEEQVIRAPITIDASGGKRFAMTRLNWMETDPHLKKIAVWGYYRGATRDAGRDEGATTITYLDGKNWLWYIPLQDDMVSVGVVGSQDYLFSETRDLQVVFDRAVQRNSWMADHMASATLVDGMHVCVHTGYRSRYCAKDGLVLAGDAFSFLDPVFSTGMFLSLRGGEAAADAAHAALEKGDCSARSFVSYGELSCRRTEVLRMLVYAFYAENFSFRKVVKKYPHLKGDVTDILVGNVDRDFSELTAAMSDFMDVPEPVPHGRAMVPGKEI